MDLESRVDEAASSAPLLTLMKEDARTARYNWGRPGLHALLVYRIGHWALTSTAPKPLRLLASVLHRLLNVLVIRNVYGLEVSANAVIGRRVLIGHHQAVQIPAWCIIGDDTVIRHNVNIGFAGSDDPLAVPHIGRDVQLGSGCALLGPIRVGHGARVGPNCVVIANVPDGATLVAPQPRVFPPTRHTPVGRKTERDEIPEEA